MYKFETLLTTFKLKILDNQNNCTVFTWPFVLGTAQLHRWIRKYRSRPQRFSVSQSSTSFPGGAETIPENHRGIALCLLASRRPLTSTGSQEGFCFAIATATNQPAITISSHIVRCGNASWKNHHDAFPSCCAMVWSEEWPINDVEQECIVTVWKMQADGEFINDFTFPREKAN